MPRRDAMRSAGTQESILPPLRLVWDREMPVWSDPVVARGRVIVESPGRITALDGEDGRLLWQTVLLETRESASISAEDVGEWMPVPPFGPAREAVDRSPIVVADTVFAWAVTMLYALDLHTGDIKWQRSMWGRPSVTVPKWPPASEDTEEIPLELYAGGTGFMTCHAGRLLVGTHCDSGRVVALQPKDGRCVWKSPSLRLELQAGPEAKLTLADPVVDGRGTLHFATEWHLREDDSPSHHTAWALDASTGTALRQTELRPLIAAEDVLIERVGGEESSELRGVEPGEGQLWQRKLPSVAARYEECLAFIAPEYSTYCAAKGLLVVGEPTMLMPKRHSANEYGVGDHRVYGVDARTGGLRWQSRLAGNDPGCCYKAALCGNVLYTRDHPMWPGITALDARTGKHMWSSGLPKVRSAVLTSGPAASRGRLFVGDYERLYALAGREPGEDPASVPPVLPGLRVRFVDAKTGKPVGAWTILLVRPGVDPDELHEHSEEWGNAPVILTDPVPPAHGQGWHPRGNGSSAAFIGNVTCDHPDRWDLYVELASESKQRYDSDYGRVRVGEIVVPHDRIAVRTVELPPKSARDRGRGPREGTTR